MSRLLDLAKQEINRKGKALELLDFIIRDLRCVLYSEFPTLSDEIMSEVEEASTLEKVEILYKISKSLMNQDEDNED